MRRPHPLHLIHHWYDSPLYEGWPLLLFGMLFVAGIITIVIMAIGGHAAKADPVEPNFPGTQVRTITEWTHAHKGPYVKEIEVNGRRCVYAEDDNDSGGIWCEPQKTESFTPTPTSVPSFSSTYGSGP